MLVGVKLVPDNRQFMAAARDRQLLMAGCGEDCIRLPTPLNPVPDITAAILARFAATCQAIASDN